jgi:ABC-2 type transport system permease protein
MNKFWRVFAYEYLRHVMRRRFIFAVISLPLFIVMIMVVSIFSVTLSMDQRPLGYVDQSGLLSSPPSTTQNWNSFSTSALIRFENEQLANEAFEQGDIQGYYVIEQDYLATGEIRLLAEEAPPGGVRTRLSNYIRSQLVKDQPPEIAQRLIEGPDIEMISYGEAQPEAPSNLLQLALPIVTGILFVMVINTSGGYLLQAVVEEKENRTIEIVITSVSPGQLMAGKIMGNLSVGLTQLLIWLLFPILAFLVLRQASPLVQDLYLDPEFVWLMLLTLVPAFILIAALMATIGATATEAREAQQIAGLFTLPVVAPYWFFVPLMTNPQGTLALALSLFPLTAPVALPLRAAFTEVPLWQSALSISLLMVCAAAALWLAGRAFRQGMLHYGKRLSWRELVRR